MQSPAADAGWEDVSHVVVDILWRENAHVDDIGKRVWFERIEKEVGCGDVDGSLDAVDRVSFEGVV